MEKMSEILYNYDIYPKAFLCDRPETITIQPLGGHVAFDPAKTYKLTVYKLSESNARHYPERDHHQTFHLRPEEDGCLRFCCTFAGEGEYYLFLHESDEAREPFAQFSVYSLEHDMAGRYPQKGDLHMHTSRSDGGESPAIVSANYRAFGYDFFAITDHHRYYPSIEAIDAFAGVTDFVIVPGEEVHLPFNGAHYINFGGSFSINAIVTDANREIYGDDPHYNSIDGNPPKRMTREEFETMIRARAAGVPREIESERMSYAVLEWTYEQVQKGGGLGVFPHPYWQCPCLTLAEDYTRFVYEKQPFDAFEVLGGERIFSHNGFQTGFYYEEKAKGFDPPVVGSTDSHGSTEHFNNAFICSTIVFTPENERLALIDSIKKKYSVAVDTISAEYRLVGDFRWIKYGSFLMEQYFPLHDLACAAEGYYMKRYACGDKHAADVLRTMKGQIPAMQKKYFHL